MQHDVRTSEMLDTLVRQRWDRLDWGSPIPRDSLVIPELHYGIDMGALGLDRDQRLRFNRLLACFTCELFIHFERYVIEYFERFPSRIPTVSPSVIRRFLMEEYVHTEMFRRVLGLLRPDLYVARSPRFVDMSPRFLHWNRVDDAVLQIAPAGTFFLLAWLFEEITLFMPQVMAEHPEDCSALLRDVMQLHAKEELPHVAIDARVIRSLEVRSSLTVWPQTLFTLPILLYVDHCVKRAWRAMALHARDELSLTTTQCEKILVRAPSRSDVLGTRSFITKLATTRLAGAAFLGWVLEQGLR